MMPRRSLGALALFAALLCAATACKFIAQSLIAYVDRWGSGTPKREGTLTAGIQTGKWTYYYENGQRRAQGEYADDHQVGPWTYYYENGNTEWRGAFDDKGRRTGEWTFYYLDEVVRARGRYTEDFEDGPWQFFHANGKPDRAGEYDAGKLSGLWSYFDANGRLKAEGLCHRGQRVGPWQLWNEAGEESAQDLGSKAGVEIVIEKWPGGARRRVGVLVDGEPAGRWQTFHENGQPRFSCSIRDGRATGVFLARKDNGEQIASGQLDGGAFVAGGRAVVAGVEQEILAGPLPVAPPAAAAWKSSAAIAAMAPEVAVGTLFAEVQAPVERQAVIAVVAEPEPPPPAVALVVAQIEQEPARVPAPMQPDLTVSQREEIDGFVADYRDGKSRTRVSRKSYEVMAPSAGGATSGERNELKGRELPASKFTAVDGQDLDLESLRGKKKLLVVILRGFLGEVCVYCVAQTEAIAQVRGTLDELGIEVVVVYPGARENQMAFQKAYELTFGKGAPPYRIYYDEDLEFVTRLGIEGDLARPTSLIVNEKGIIEYAYVGEHKADRPAAKKLIKLIEGMKQ